MQISAGSGIAAGSLTLEKFSSSALGALVPVGAILPWLKTFTTKDSGTTSATTANKLVQAGQNFVTTVAIGDCVYNTTDLTYAYVTAVDSNTQLSISADIMTSGENYTIYATPALADGFVECNGQVLSNANSKYNGATIPNLNGTTDTDKLFLRGAKFSGTTGGSFDNLRTGSRNQAYSGMTNLSFADSPSAFIDYHAPPYYEVVFIMRIY